MSVICVPIPSLQLEVAIVSILGFSFPGHPIFRPV